MEEIGHTPQSGDAQTRFEKGSDGMIGPLNDIVKTFGDQDTPDAPAFDIKEDTPQLQWDMFSDLARTYRDAIAGLEYIRVWEADTFAERVSELPRFVAVSNDSTVVLRAGAGLLLKVNYL